MKPRLPSFSSFPRLRLGAEHIVSIYATFAVLWVIVSGELIEFSIHDPIFAGRLEIGKGLLFVLVTSSLLFLLLKTWQEPKITSTANSSNPVSAPRRHWLAIALLCLGLITLVPALGLIIVKIQGPQTERASYTDLQAIAVLKAEQIESWLDERHHDANGLMNSQDNIQRIAGMLQTGNPIDTNFVRRRLKSMIRPYGFSAALLLDARGNPKMAQGTDTQLLPATPELVAQALASGQMQSSNIVYDAHGKARLDFVAPLFLSNHSGRVPVAVVVLRIVPEEFLFPLIRRWPGAQTSGKTLLVRRKGESVEFLNRLVSPASPVTPARPRLNDPDLPSAKAIRDMKPGITEGIDYQGVPVLAAYRPIAGTDWHIIVKVNRDEVFAPLNNLLFWVSMVTFFAIIALSVALLLLWRKNLQLTHAELTVQANELFKHFYDLPFLGMTTWSPHTNELLQVNNRFCEIVGYSREELIGMNRNTFSHPDDRARELRENEKLLSGESDSYQLEKRYLRKDGIIVTGSLDARCVRREDGSIDFVAATIQDITTQKAMQQELLDSEESYRTLADSGQAMIWTAGLDTLCNYFNKVWLDFTGRSLVQEWGKGWTEGVHPEDFARCVETYTKAFERREKFSMDYRLRRHDGEYRWIQDDGSPCYNRAGEFVGYIGYCLDITERYLIRQALTESETKLRTMIGNLPIVLCTIDSAGLFTMFEGKALEQIGFKPGEVVGQSVFEVFRGNAHLLESIGRALQGEYIHTEHDISGIWFESFHQPFSGAGQDAGIMITSINITARKKAENELRLSLNRMECLNRITDYPAHNTRDLLDFALHEILAFNGSPLGHIFRYAEETQEFTLVSWSRTAMESCRIQKPETCYALPRTGFWGESVRQRKPVINNDFLAPHPLKQGMPAGHVVMQRFMSLPILLNEQIVGVVGLANKADDYTQADLDQLSLLMSSVWHLVEQREAAEALQRATDQLKISQTLAQVGGWEVDTRDKTIYWTDETYRIHEVEAANFKPSIQTALDFYAPNSITQVSAALNKAMNEGGGFDLELELITAKGNHRQVHTSCQVHKEDGKVVRVGGAIQDITAYKNIESELRKHQEHLAELVAQRTSELVDARDTAERATKAKSAFLANMSHEIRTPINAVLGMAHLAQRTELTPKQKSYMDKIMISANLLLGVINDILDFSKIEAGRLELSSNEFLLGSVMDKIIAVISQKAADKHLEFLVQIDPGTPLSLIGDAARLGQILINLCSNAVKFTDSGEVLLHVSHTSWLRDESVELLFTVKDSGIGLSSQQIAQLFRPFSQADTSDTRRFGGTGLGLAICKQLSEMMGGHIWATSKPGTGSEFSFSASFQLGKSSPAPAAPLSADWHHMQVLVTDRNATGREILAGLLRGFGFTVSSQGSAVEALLEVVSGKKPLPDLLLIDHREARDEAASLVTTIRQRHKNVRVILMSSSGDPENEKLHTLVAPDAEAVKPITASSLLDAVMIALGGKTTPNAAQLNRFAHSKKSSALLGARVLLVEDNAFNQQIAQELLESAGMEVVVAENGQEAIHHAAQEPFDIILMDVQMPVMDGLEATRCLRAKPEYADIPIVAMTAHAMVDEQNHCLEAGMDGFLSKPIDPELLISTIAEHIHNKITTKPAALAAAVEPPAPRPPGLPSQIPGISMQTGLHYCGDNAEFYLRMLGEFLRNKPDSGQQLRDALAQADETTAHRLAHTMKSVAGSIGATDLSGIAAEVDQAIRGKIVSSYPALCERFDAELGKVIAGLKAHLPATPQPASLAKTNDAPPSQIAEKIRQYLDTDLGEALDLLPALTAALAGSPAAALGKHLSIKLNSIEIDAAKTILDELIAGLRIPGGPA